MENHKTRDEAPSLLLAKTPQVLGDPHKLLFLCFLHTQLQHLYLSASPMRTSNVDATSQDPRPSARLARQRDIYLHLPRRRTLP